tara:strand:- start:53 stop:628 length:576 start_codon:yes stop_codon:yes gene_type:complete
VEVILYLETPYHHKLQQVVVAEDETVKDLVLHQEVVQVEMEVLVVEVVEKAVPLMLEQVEQEQHVKETLAELEQVQVVAVVVAEELTLLEQLLLVHQMVNVVSQVEQVEQEKILVLYFQDHQIVVFMLEVVEVVQVLHLHQELPQLEEQVVVEHLNVEVQLLQHQEQLTLAVVVAELAVEPQEIQEQVAQE